MELKVNKTIEARLKKSSEETWVFFQQRGTSENENENKKRVLKLKAAQFFSPALNHLFDLTYKIDLCLLCSQAVKARPKGWSFTNKILVLQRQVIKARVQAEIESLHSCEAKLLWPVVAISELQLLKNWPLNLRQILQKEVLALQRHVIKARPLENQNKILLLTSSFWLIVTLVRAC